MNKPCLIDECPKPAGVPGTAHGWCSTHYTRWKRTGDPLMSLTDLKPKVPVDCSVDGCDSPRWARGLCGTHYARWRKRGAAGEAERETKPRTGRCSIQNCKRVDRTLGLCAAHYHRYNKYGDPLATPIVVGLHEKCSARFCERVHYARGLCHQHWYCQARIEDRENRLQRDIAGFFTPEQMVARIDYFGNRCWMCGGPADQMDHVKPLSKGGSHWLSNLRPACAGCNYRKSRKWPFIAQKTDWIKGLIGDPMPEPEGASAA